MKIRDLLVSIGFKVDQSSKKDADNAIESIKKAAAQAGVDIDKMTESVDRATGEVGKLGDEAQDTAGDMGQVSAQGSRAMQDVSETAGRAEVSVSQLGGEAQEAAGSMGEIGGAASSAMSTVSEAAGRAEASVSQLGDEAEQVAQQTSSIGGAFQSTQQYAQSFGNVGGMSLGDFARKALGAAAGIATLGGFLKKGFDRANMLDTAKAKLDFLNKDIEGYDYDKIYEGAKAAVKGTAYGMDEAMTVAASAMGAGVKQGDDLNNYLQLISDTSAIAGTSYQEMGYLINKVTAQGKLSGEELAMLNDRGLDVVSMLSKATGKGVNEIRDSISKGEISAKEFRQVLGEEMQGAAKAMGESTLSATITNIGSSISRMSQYLMEGADGNGGIFGTLKDDLPKLLDWMQDHEEIFSKIGTVLGTAFQGVIEGVKIFLSPLKTLVDLFSKVSGHGKHIKALKPVFTVITGAVMGLVTAMGIMKGVMMVQKGLTIAATAVEAIRNGQLVLQAGATNAVTGAQMGLNAAMLASPLTWIILAIMAVVVVLVLLQKKFHIFTRFFKFMKKLGGEFVASFKEMGKAFAEIGKAILKPFIKIKDFFMGIVDFFRKKVEGIKNAFKKGGITGAIGHIAKGFFGLHIMAGKAVAKLASKVGKQFTKLGKNAKKKVSSMASSVTKKFSNMRENMKIRARKAAKDVHVAWSGMKAQAKERMEAVRTAIKNVFEKIGNFFRGLPKKALQWGKDFINGLKDGITSSIQGIVDKVEGLADKIKGFLHFSRPDYGPLRDYEQWMPDFIQGMAAGIDANKDTLLNRVHGMADDLSLMLNANVGASPGTVGGTSMRRSTIMTQNVNISNSYTGSDPRKGIVNTMKKSSADATDYMARALSYARG